MLQAGFFTLQGVYEQFGALHLVPLHLQPGRGIDASSQLPKSEWCRSHNRVTPSVSVRRPYSDLCRTCQYAEYIDKDSIYCAMNATLYAYVPALDVGVRYLLRGDAYREFGRMTPVFWVVERKLNTEQKLSMHVFARAKTYGNHDYYAPEFRVIPYSLTSSEQTRISNLQEYMAHHLNQVAEETATED